MRLIDPTLYQAVHKHTFGPEIYNYTKLGTKIRLSAFTKGVTSRLTSNHRSKIAQSTRPDARMYQASVRRIHQHHKYSFLDRKMLQKKSTMKFDC